MFVHLSLSDPKLHRVAPNLYFADRAGGCAPHAVAGAAIVHACKDPCHRRAVGHEKKIDPNHPEYLFAERGQQLYLNMIDPPLPLFKRESFAKFLTFTDCHIAQRPVVIHCNQGMSRAPSLALLYMAKRLNLLPRTDYAAARREFENHFPYSPGSGIVQFLSENWDAI